MSSAYGEDLAYIHHTGFGEFAESAAPGLIEILRKNGVREGLVVEIGCGSGILARALIDAGYDVLGVDASPHMIRLARETVDPSPGPALRSGPPSPRSTGRGVFDIGSFASVRIPKCAAVVAMGEVLNYGVRGDLPPFFARVAEAGAMLVFDFAERGSYPAYDEVRVDGDDFVVIAVKESDGTHLTRRITTYREGRRTRETHTLELYDRRDVARLLREAGFRVRFRRSYRTRRLPKGHAVCVGIRR